MSAPTITNITGPADGHYRAGQTLTFTVTFSENITVSGTSSALGLTIGSTGHTAAYASKTANSITYSYTVQAGDNDGDGIVLDAIDLGDDTIRAAAGDDDANIALTAFSTIASRVYVDTTAPTTTELSVPAGTFALGEEIIFTLKFSEVVTVEGSPTLTLTAGSTSRTATHLSTDGGTVTFGYTVQAGGR